MALMGRPPAHRWPWSTPAERAAVSSMLDRLGLAGLERRHIRELSGGQQQRVFVARALLQGAELLVLDFNHNTFNTQLTVSYPGTSGTQQETLTASGTLDRHTGIFLGNPADKTTRIAGALAQDIRQAGYLFNKTLGNAAISGATLWNR